MIFFFLLLSLPLNADEYIFKFSAYISNIKIGEVDDEISIEDSNFSIKRKLIPAGPLVLFLSNRKEITHGIFHDEKIFISKYFLKTKKKNMLATLDFKKKKYIIDNKEINFSTNKSVLNIATIQYRFLIEDIKFTENYDFQFLKNDSIKNYSFKKIKSESITFKNNEYPVYIYERVSSDPKKRTRIWYSKNTPRIPMKIIFSDKKRIYQFLLKSYMKITNE